MRYTSFLSGTNVGQGKLTGRRKGLRRAVAAVEMAVLAPFLAFLFVITVDFARVFYYQLTLDDCARNGALLGSSLRSYQETGWVNPYNDIVAVTVADGASLNPPLDPSQVTVSGGTGSDGNPNVTVTIQYPFASITHFPGFGDTLNLQATVSMRVAPPK
jgi:Flp pilus assembly protein TadG